MGNKKQPNRLSWADLPKQEQERILMLFRCGRSVRFLSKLFNVKASAIRYQIHKHQLQPDLRACVNQAALSRLEDGRAVPDEELAVQVVLDAGERRAEQARQDLAAPSNLAGDQVSSEVRRTEEETRETTVELPPTSEPRRGEPISTTNVPSHSRQDQEHLSLVPVFNVIQPQHPLHQASEVVPPKGTSEFIDMSSQGDSPLISQEAATNTLILKEHRELCGQLRTRILELCKDGTALEKSCGPKQGMSRAAADLAGALDRVLQAERRAYGLMDKGELKAAVIIVPAKLDEETWADAAMKCAAKQLTGSRS